jgi:Carboxypeptidase regulatory-like domain
MKPLVAACVLCVLVPRLGLAQIPAGTISGVVRDQASAVISGADVHVVSRATGHLRRTTTGEHGEYSIPALLPGEYDVTVDAARFQRIVRAATVEAGTTTRSDFVLRVGDVTESVRVEAATPQLRFDAASVSGSITRDQIEGLPLNGRTFLELGKLEPGVQQPAAANRNRTVVPVLGAPASNVGGARFTVDGGSVTAVALGGSQMGFSQEVVQEFQVSTVNFDLAAGMTDTGSINVVTRGGGNQSTASYDAHSLRNRRVKQSVCAQVDFVNGSAFREPCC